MSKPPSRGLERGFGVPFTVDDGAFEGFNFVLESCEVVEDACLDDFT